MNEGTPEWERRFDERFLPEDMERIIGWRGLSYRVNFHEVKEFIRDLLARQDARVGRIHPPDDEMGRAG
jgi:hypothetical protein